MKKCRGIIFILLSVILHACLSQPDPIVYDENLAVGTIGPGGGIIFYDDDIGFDFNGDGKIVRSEMNLMRNQRFLEVAVDGWYGTASDPILESGIMQQKSNGNYKAPIIRGIRAKSENSNYYYPEDYGNSRDTVGDGYNDTQKIYEYIENMETPITGTAIQTAVLYRGGGLDDWFQPSIGEAFILRTVADDLGLNGLDAVMTSTLSSGGQIPLGIYEIDGEFLVLPTVAYHLTGQVRPIRAF